MSKNDREVSAPKMPVPASNCLNCRYSGVAGPQTPEAYVCRFDPPKVSLGPQPNPLTGQVGMASFPLWPPVSHYDWCSKWGPKVNA